MKKNMVEHIVTKIWGCDIGLSIPYVNIDEKTHPPAWMRLSVNISCNDVSLIGCEVSQVCG